ncbi:MAG: beta-galactosidase trimerization domain-containing protein [Candidatus Glassbacteria bacterium]
MKAAWVPFLLILVLSTGAPPAAGQKKFYQPQRASWIDRGVVLGWGNHEAFIFRIRKGGGAQFDPQWQEWLGEHSEQTVIAAKNAGIEVFHTHGYKGFGYEAEKSEMEQLAQLSKLVHQHGMKLDTYCQVMTLVPETFYAEEPAAKDWVQRDELGRPILLSYGFQQSYRYKPSLIHPDYRQYYKEKILRTLIEKCNTDLLHFDNFDCNAEPESDKSPVVVEAFREYLERKYPTDKQRIERFGHTNLRLIPPPEWNQTNRPDDIREIVDPIQQEWIDFRCWVMADWLREMTAFARSLKPEIAIDVNPHGILGRNRAFQAALWHPWFMKYTELIWSEEENYADYDDRGVLISKIRTFKLGRALDNVILTYKATDLQHAENLAFNQALADVNELRPDTPEYKYYRFYMANRDLYTGTRNREDAALLRSYATMAYDNHRAELDQCMFEQAMIQGQVPFDLVYDEQMDDLSCYRVLVLAGQNNLSDENVEKVRAFVEGGGALVFTGESSRNDGWARRRPQPALAGLIGIESARGGRDGRGGAFSNKIETARGGRVIYVPEIVPPDRRQADSWSGSWGGEEGRANWLLPANWRELVGVVRRAAGGRLSVEVGVPDYVAVEQVEKAGLLAVHLVNYKAGSRLAGIPVEVTTGREKKVREVRLLSPDLTGTVKLDFTLEEGICRFVVPSLEVYDVIAISL